MKNNTSSLSAKYSKTYINFRLSNEITENTRSFKMVQKNEIIVKNKIIRNKNLYYIFFQNLK